MLSHLESALQGRGHQLVDATSSTYSYHTVLLQVAAMTVTAFPSEGSPDLALLNVARLFTRLEHNLLSPGSDRRSIQQSEYQRMRVNKVSIYSTFPEAFISKEKYTRTRNLTNTTER